MLASVFHTPDGGHRPPLQAFAEISMAVSVNIGTVGLLEQAAEGWDHSKTRSQPPRLPVARSVLECAQSSGAFP